MKKVVIVLLVVGSAALAYEYIDRGPRGTPYYLTQDDYAQVRAELKKPPAAGSSEEKSDDDFMRSIQKSRTPADCVRANTEVKVSMKTFFGKPYGPLTDDEIKKFDTLSLKLLMDSKYFSQRLKNEYARPRPFVTLKDLKPCLPLEANPSYPSGHSLISHLFAAILDEAMPDRKEVIDARADQIASDRVLGGVHYPSDIAAGKNEAEIIFQLLKKSPKFMNDLNSVTKK